MCFGADNLLRLQLISVFEMSIQCPDCPNSCTCLRCHWYQNAAETNLPLVCTTLIGHGCPCCSQREVQQVVQHLQQELQSAKAATGNLHAQYAAQQAQWEGIVKNLQV